MYIEVFKYVLPWPSESKYASYNNLKKYGLSKIQDTMLTHAVWYKRMKTPVSVTASAPESAHLVSYQMTPFDTRLCHLIYHVEILPRIKYLR